MNLTFRLFSNPFFKAVPFKNLLSKHCFSLNQPSLFLSSLQKSFTPALQSIDDAIMRISTFQQKKKKLRKAKRKQRMKKMRHRSEKRKVRSA